LILIAMCGIVTTSLAQRLVEIPTDLTTEKLDSLKLETGVISYVSDKYSNRIIGISQEGKQLSKGDKIKQGSTVDLVLGDGVSDKICVPNLVGLTIQEAEKILKQVKLQVGTITNQKSNSIHEKVVNQFPLPTRQEMNEMQINERNMLKEGEKVNIWIK
jgi:eukaryotic-like serine/threonine-protein kinase